MENASVLPYRATFHAVPNGAGAYMVVMRSTSHGDHRIALPDGPLTWRSARSAAKACAKARARVGLRAAPGYARGVNADGGGAGLVRLAPPEAA